MGVLAFLSPILAAALVLHRLFSRAAVSPRWAVHCLSASLAIPLGAAVSSVLYFLIAACGLASPAIVLAMDGVLIAAGVSALSVRRAAIAPPIPEPGFRWNWLLATGLSAACAFVLAGLLTVTPALPFGDWDAWSIWSLRGKLLAGEGAAWRRTVMPGFTGHLDYPLLLPGFLAQPWKVLGAAPQWVPEVTGYAFLLASIGIVTATVALLRRTSAALLSGLVLISATSFVTMTTMQYADLPLACYFAAALALVLLGMHPGLSRRTCLLLAGACASAAAWTKNEGLLFVPILFCVCLLASARQDGLRRAAGNCLPLLLGAAPVLLVVAWFKLMLVPTQDAVLQQTGAQVMTKLADAGRYWRIVRALAGEAYALGQPWTHPLLQMAILAVGLRFRRNLLTAPFYSAALSLTLLLLGYCGIYLLTPMDLAWHLQTSLARLYGQLWPSAVLVFFAALRTPEEAAAGER